ncbi:zinc protease [Gemmobacter aquatilis]|uniref:Zinc protease n=1 Tax=Gemmobacter aquatilis TaxID=933059 RepID=A0A1H7ZZ78_9RHOB|nr:pitrilysin family protein [Gemmobacter aquatilis]SEM62637.1 zinc protease [Gemmobacter aquatilis]
MIWRLVALFALIALPLQAETNIQEVTSPGGIKAWLVEEHGIPFTALEIRFRGGTSLDAEGKRGAVNLMTALIEEGAAEMNAQKFAESRDALAAEFRFNASVDSVSVSARMLTENRARAAELLRLAINHPRFDADAVERVRGQVLTNIRAGEKDPGTIAGDVFSHMAFGDHPYGSSGDGTQASVAALTRDDILAAHRGAMARDRLYVAAVGDITPEELGALLDHLLGELPATGAPLPGPAKVGLTGGVMVQPFPTPQAVVMFGHDGIPRDDPDYFAAFVLNEIVGGDRFTARLMIELREKRGLTYGVGSYLADYDQADLVLGEFATDNRTAGQAVEVLRQEWARAAQGVTEAELSAAKTYLTGAYPLRFDGNGTIANILVGMQMSGYDKDYPKTRNARIEAVTLADVARVAKRIYRPDDLRIVVVGQPEGLPAP